MGKKEKANKKSGVRSISVDEIRESSNQPRSFTIKEEFEALVESIKCLGILEPLQVKKTKDGYEIKDGHRRLEAAKRISLVEVPCVITETNAVTDSVMPVVVNMVRENLNWMDIAKAWKKLHVDMGLSLDKIAKMHGKSKPWVSQVLSVFDMDLQLQAAIESGQLDIPKAKQIWRVRNDERRNIILHQVIEDGASLRVVASWVQQELSIEYPNEFQPSGVSLGEVPPPPPKLTFPCAACYKELTGNQLVYVMMCVDCRQWFLKLIQDLHNKEEKNVKKTET